MSISLEYYQTSVKHDIDYYEGIIRTKPLLLKEALVFRDCLGEHLKKMLTFRTVEPLLSIGFVWAQERYETSCGEVDIMATIKIQRFIRSRGQWFSNKNALIRAVVDYGREILHQRYQLKVSGDQPLKRIKVSEDQPLERKALYVCTVDSEEDNAEFRKCLIPLGVDGPYGYRFSEMYDDLIESRMRGKSVVVLDSENRVQAAARLHFSIGETDSYVEIFALGSAFWNKRSPRHQQDPRRVEGAGTVLIEQLIFESFSAGRKGHLVLLPAQKSIGFYKKLGFTFVTDDDADKLELHFTPMNDDDDDDKMELTPDKIPGFLRDHGGRAQVFTKQISPQRFDFNEPDVVSDDAFDSDLS